jgi:hypothetical protein
METSKTRVKGAQNGLEQTNKQSTRVIRTHNSAARFLIELLSRGFCVLEKQLKTRAKAKEPES